jgi:hypothetical protein
MAFTFRQCERGGEQLQHVELAAETLCTPLSSAVESGVHARVLTV